MRFSTAARLTICYLAIFAVMELILGTTTWLMLRRHLYEQADIRVEMQIRDLKRLLQTQAAEAPVADLQKRISQKYSDDHVGDFVELYLKSGELVYRSPILEANSDKLYPPDRVKRPMEKTLVVAGRPFHFLLERISANGRVFIVATGVPAGDSVSILRHIRFYLWLIGSLLWVVAGFVVYPISRRMVSPARV